jgi:hypothetical protein
VISGRTTFEFGNPALAGFLLRHNNVYSASGSINTAPPHVRTKKAPYSKRETIAARIFIVNPDHLTRAMTSTVKR